MAEASSRGESPVTRPDTRGPAETTFALIRRAQDGDVAAREELCARYLPRLERWAHGRLPEWARGALDTHDLVQDTFIQVLRRIGEFEPRHEGAFHAYLRQALINRVRDEIRRAQRRSPAEPLDTDNPSREPSPLEITIGHEALERYEAALGRLKPDDQSLIVLRIEQGYPYAEMAAALDKSVAAVQMGVSRALVRLAGEMARGRS